MIIAYKALHILLCSLLVITILTGVLMLIIMNKKGKK